MKVQYGNSTRNSLQPKEANTETNCYDANKEDEDNSQRCSLLNYNKNSIVNKSPNTMRTSQTPNNQSSNKKVQSLGFFINTSNNNHTTKEP